MALVALVACDRSVAPAELDADNSLAYFPKLERPRLSRVEWTPPEGPRQLVFLLVDALRPDHVGAYGYARGTTPRLDRLAAEGIVFTNAYANAPWTRPSVASMLTGLHPVHHGLQEQQQEHRLAPEILTVAEGLRAAGFATGGFSANGNGGALFGLDAGFDTYRSPTRGYGGLPRAERVFESALAFIRQHRHEDFFAFLFVVDPHDPYAFRPGYESFRDATLPELIASPRWEYAEAPPSPDQVRQIVNAYDSLVKYVDDRLGEFLDALDAEGLRENLVFLVASDHGEAFGEHGFFKHAHHFWDEVVRLPLVLAGPGLGGAGGYFPGLVQGIDLHPTLLELAGVERPAPRRGRSVLGVDASDLSQRVVLGQYRSYGIHRESARTRRWLLVRQQAADAELFDRHVQRRSLFPSVIFQGERVRLFDLAQDPGATRDVADERPAIRAALEAALQDLATDAEGLGAAPVAAGPLPRAGWEHLRALGYID